MNWRVAYWLLAAALMQWAPIEVQAQRIAIGMSSPLTGPNASYGTGLRHGVMTAIRRTNESGGIGGRQIELLVMDDGGDPERTLANTRRLVQEGVLALTGFHGAASVQTVLKEIELAGLALVGPATSADSLRRPVNRGLFHLRAGTSEEMSAVMLHLDTLGMTRIAVLAQDDGLGNSALGSLELELGRMAMRPVATVSLGAKDGDGGLQRAMNTLCAVQPQAIVLAIDAPRVRDAVLQGRRNGCMVQFVALSEAGPVLQSYREGQSNPLGGLLVTQVVPHPSALSHPLVVEYQKVLASHGAEAGSPPSLEGYLAMRVIVEALRNCGRELGRACVEQALLTKKLELPGRSIQLGGNQRLAKPFVEITLLDTQGRFRR